MAIQKRFFAFLLTLAVFFGATGAAAEMLRLVKYDADGNLLWVNEDRQSEVYGAKIRAMRDGHLFVSTTAYLARADATGNLSKKINGDFRFSPELDQDENMIADSGRKSLAKWSTEGSVIWEKEFSDTCLQAFDGYDDEHLYLVGDHSCNPGDANDGRFVLLRMDADGKEHWRVGEDLPDNQLPAYFLVDAHAGDPVFVYRAFPEFAEIQAFDTDGTLRWSKVLDFNPNFFGILAAVDGSVIFVCDPRQAGDDWDPLGGGFVAQKFDVDGNLLWTFGPIIPGCAMCGLGDGMITDAGHLILSGSIEAEGDYSSEDYDDQKWAVFDVAPNGELVWRRVFNNLPGRNRMFVKAFTADKFGNLIAGGYASDVDGDAPTTDSAAFLYKLDSDGEVLWSTTYDSDYSYFDDLVLEDIDGCDRFTDAVVDDEGNIYVAGTYDGPFGEEDDDDDDDEDDEACGCGC